METHARWRVGPQAVLVALALGCGGTNEGTMDAGVVDVDPRLDVAPVEIRPPPPGPLGCRAVDVLFMIDNSPSMRPRQERLAAAFPTFVDAMFERLPRGTDLHVGITTSSFYVGQTGEGHMDCRTTATRDYVLSRYTRPDQMNNGENGGQGRLFRHDNRFFYSVNTDGDRQALMRWFTSATRAVGEEASSVECSSAGIAYAAHPANRMTNEGFIRDLGAVLVVIALTDEPDKSPEGARVYRDLIVAAKRQCGGARCVVAAGIMPPCARNVNDPLWEFLASFDRPVTFGDIEGTAMDYTRTVGETLATTVRDLCSAIPAPP